MKWHNGYVYPIYGNKEFYFIETRKLYECKQFNHQISLTAGTVIHKTKLSLRIWFLAIYLIANSKRGISALSLSKELKINYRTSWRSSHKIRHAIGERDDVYNLSKYIEMDDSYIGTKVEKGIKIITDGYQTYKYLNQDYIHMSLNYSEADSDELLRISFLEDCLILAFRVITMQ